MKRCVTCKNTYPLDFFERFHDDCIACMDKPREPTRKRSIITESDSEWKPLNTVARIDDLFRKQRKR